MSVGGKLWWSEERNWTVSSGKEKKRWVRWDDLTLHELHHCLEPVPGTVTLSWAESTRCRLTDHHWARTEPNNHWCLLRAQLWEIQRCQLTWMSSNCWRKLFSQGKNSMKVSISPIKDWVSKLKVQANQESRKTWKRNEWRRRQTNHGNTWRTWQKLLRAQTQEEEQSTKLHVNDIMSSSTQLQTETPDSVTGPWQRPASLSLSPQAERNKPNWAEEAVSTGNPSFWCKFKHSPDGAMEEKAPPDVSLFFTQMQSYCRSCCTNTQTLIKTDFTCSHCSCSTCIHTQHCISHFDLFSLSHTHSLRGVKSLVEVRIECSLFMKRVLPPSAHTHSHTASQLIYNKGSPFIIDARFYYLFIHHYLATVDVRSGYHSHY